MSVRPPQYIVIEGVIGVGKTTLVRALERRLQARTVYEVFEENPFLERFYEDKDRYAFPTEMFFLLSRFDQQRLFAQEDLLQRFAVSDYLFEKCRLFSSLTLSETEHGLFERVYEILHAQVPTPDLVIHLHAPIAVIEERIQSRGRSYERTMDPAYLAELDAGYRRLFASYRAAPVLSVDTTATDFRVEAHVDALLEQIGVGPDAAG